MRSLCGSLLLVSVAACRPASPEPMAPVQLRSAWVELPAVIIEIEDGTRVVAGCRYRFVGNDIVVRFDYRKLGEPGRSGAQLDAELKVTGAQVQGGPATWSLGREGPNLVERRLATSDARGGGIVVVQYIQRASSPGRRSRDARARTCFVWGPSGVREARRDECGL